MDWGNGTCTDRQLAAACAAGDREAGEVLLRRHQRSIFLVCRRVTGNDEDAHDALQDTLVAVWRNMANYRGDARFSTWVHRIATNAAIAHVQRQERASSTEARVPVPAQRSGPEERVVAQHEVDWALAKLPAQYRAAVVLRDLLDLPYEEIAYVLDVPMNTAKTRISRGRQALVELLGVADRGVASGS